MQNISLVETEEINNKIQQILRQTNFSQEEAREKLKEYDFNEILVIKSYFGIVDKKNEDIKSVNQEIYKQLRFKLDSAMRDYNERVKNVK